MADDLIRLREEAWLGDALVAGAVRGVVLSLHGLGGGYRERPSETEAALAARGWLVVFPYYGPWSWMNPPARAMIDRVLDAVWQVFRLPDALPLVSLGVSMGGQGGLVHARFSRRPVRACLAMSPVCDLLHHRRERPDVAPTLRHAFPATREQSFEASLREHSPLFMIDVLPLIPYRIIHGAHDAAVSKAAHSDRLAEAMRRAGHAVNYVELPDMGHAGRCPTRWWRATPHFWTGRLMISWSVSSRCVPDRRGRCPAG
jgi:dipeptidyl aminopeptidase/acylaminoacyl peptidase